jgi:hypothetical protein
MGSIVEGHIRLFGHVRKCIFRKNEDPNKRTYPAGDWYDDATYGEREVPELRPVLLPIAFSGPHSAFAKDGTVESYYPATITGLILRAVSADDDTYERIGIFTHPLGEYCTEEHSEKYPEFSDFDTDNFERQIITLV